MYETNMYELYRVILKTGCLEWSLYAEVSVFNLSNNVQTKW